MRTLGELHTLRSLPSLRSLDPIVREAFSEDEEWVGQSEGEEEDDRVAPATVRGALSALQRLHCTSEDAASGGTTYLACELSRRQRAGQGSVQGGRQAGGQGGG